MAEVHNLSLFLMETLEANHQPLDMSLAALALTFVRLANPFERLSQSREIALTKELMEFAQMTSRGPVN